jgi:hypothetical protein
MSRSAAAKGAQQSGSFKIQLGVRKTFGRIAGARALRKTSKERNKHARTVPHVLLMNTQSASLACQVVFKNKSKSF